MLNNKHHPMCVEFSDVLDIVMDSVKTPIRTIIFRSNLSNDTIGVKSV